MEMPHTINYSIPNARDIKISPLRLEIVHFQLAVAISSSAFKKFVTIQCYVCCVRFNVIVVVRHVLLSYLAPPPNHKQADSLFDASRNPFVLTGLPFFQVPYCHTETSDGQMYS